MRILYELSWLWETLGIALVAAAVCMACAALICKAAKKNLGKKVLAVIGGCCICGRDSGGHSDCPDADAALIGRRTESCRFKSSEMTSQK